MSEGDRQPNAAGADPMWERLPRLAEPFRVQLDSQRLADLQHYSALLSDWSQRFNLTALTDPEQILLRHFLDSLTCARAVDLMAVGSLIDVGSGAGFPGLVLKITHPHLHVVLLDAVLKRLRFLERVVESLGLHDVQVVHGRAEDVGRPLLRAATGKERQPRGTGAGPPCLREQFDLVTARAVARLNVLAEWTLPLAAVGGGVLAMKGPGVEGEVAEAGPAIRRLGGGKARIWEFTLPETDIGRSLVWLPKASRTPPDLPRLPGSARKAPLTGKG